MKIISIFAILLLPCLSFAGSYYCNGNTKQSGSSWYYPNGNTAQSGSSVYYPNGNTLKSGSSLYYRNGNTLRSGDSLYYANGNTLKSGSSFYYQNGNTLKSDSSCYHQNGNSIGDCPRSYNISLAAGDNSLDATLNLRDGNLAGLSHQFTVSNSEASIVLDENGDILDIRHICSGTLDPAVQAILLDYKSLDAQKKSQVRDQICGP